MIFYSLSDNEVYYIDDEVEDYEYHLRDEDDIEVENYSSVPDDIAVARTNDLRNPLFYVVDEKEFGIDYSSRGSELQIIGEDFWDTYKDDLEAAIIRFRSYDVEFTNSHIHHKKASSDVARLSIYYGVTSTVWGKIVERAYNDYINLNFSFMHKPITFRKIYSSEIRDLLLPHWEYIGSQEVEVRTIFGASSLVEIYTEHGRGTGDFQYKAWANLSILLKLLPPAKLKNAVIVLDKKQVKLTASLAKELRNNLRYTLEISFDRVVCDLHQRKFSDGDSSLSVSRRVAEMLKASKTSIPGISIFKASPYGVDL